MAESDNVRIPTVTAEDKNLKWATVKILLPGLTTDKSMVLFGTQKPSKNCAVNINMEESSLSLAADIKDKKGKTTVYKYKANQLPEKIHPEQSKTTYEKNMVILGLCKQEEMSWEVKLAKSGLDQNPDTE